MSLRRREQCTTVLDKQEDTTPPFELDDNEVPTSDPGVVPITMGWDAAEDDKSKSRFPDRLKLGETPVLVKFLTVEPISWHQHFVASKNKPYVCLKGTPRGCPLCAIGDEPRARHVLTVADLSGEEAVVKKLEFGVKLLRELKQVHNGPRGPLDRFCIRLSSHGEGYAISYTVDVVKDRDLEEEEGITPEAVAEAIKDFEPLGIDSIYTSSYEDVLEVAESLV